MDLRNNQQIIQFLHQYFTANHCDIIEVSDEQLTVQLTVELDKALMNRPFYWQYIESTGRTGSPKRMTFSTELKEDPKVEWIHFGSPRLQQIFHHMNQVNKYVQLFEVCQTDEKTLLEPWLLTNNLIIYEGKQKKEQLVSIGLNLINGTMVFNMMKWLDKLPFSPTISAYCYTISPLISLQSGFKRVEQAIYSMIDQENLQWAERSYRLMQEEIEMATHFYDIASQTEQLSKEIADIENRLQPTISHQVLNGGILYLSKSFIKRLKE